MYQIFVVEDELLIRQSIRNVIENMPGPYALCGEASDGEMALAMMQDLMPDILITDIRMPFLDGFGLIKNCKVMMPWLKVVIISGYGDFESAQKAISLGVDQYLLKPIRQADLVKVIEETASQIEKSKASGGTVLPEGMDEEEVLKVLRQHFMRQLLYDEADTAKLLDRMQRLKLDIMRKNYLVAVFSFDSPQTDHQLLEKIVMKVLDETQMLMVYFNNADRMTLLAYDNDPETLNERVYQFISILRHELQDICPVITTVISNNVQRLGEISDAYRTAYGLMKTVSGIAAGQVINVNDTAQISAQIIRKNTPLYDVFRKKIEDSDSGQAEAILDEISLTPMGEQFNSRLMRYNALMALMKIAVQMIGRAKPEEDERDIEVELSGQFDILKGADSRSGFRKTAKELIEKALNARQGVSGEIRNHHVISKAESYVKENFCDPNISLISVANHVNMSAAYFSTVFSQTTGRSFINYLTQMRVDKAKELLCSTNLKLSDIALDIGYNEPNYFSHVFRKTTGMTPKEYRNKNQK